MTAAGIVAILAVPAAATIVNFCGGNYGGGAYCSRQASFSLNAISVATPSSSNVCVYRATADYDGAPSASGLEYCIPSGQTSTAQAFHGFVGNPTVHNNNGFQVNSVGAAYDRN